jgi:hypothetical protein
VPLSLLLPSLTSLLSFAFAALLVARFATRGRTYYAAWAIGVACFGVASAAEAVGGAVGWQPALYRWWYLCGAICVAAYLGAGSLYLHAGRTLHRLLVVAVVLGCVPAWAGGYRVEALVGAFAATALAVIQLRTPEAFNRAALAALALGTLLAAARVLTTPLESTMLPAREQIATGQAFAEDIRILTPMFNIPGALLLLLGAFLSATKWRDDPTRLASSALIAMGAFVPSLASSLTRFGQSDAFYVGQFVGVLCLLAGFALSVTSGQPRLRPSV